jgi:oxygen-dependent protoporphyrinogen oxidase
VKQVVIIGGGIAGLSAAWYIGQYARRDGLPIQVTVLEASNRWGGKIYTETVDAADGSFVIEAGPDSFLTQKPWALELARELGLGDRLLGTNDRLRTVYVLHRGKPIPMPDGLAMIVPTKLMPFLRSPLLSPLAKLRMGLDLLLPARRDPSDETLAAFVRRRLGNAALEQIAEPLMSGIYNAEAERQSILATFPRFRQLEREHGGLIRGMRASQRRAVPTGKPKLPAFVSLPGGTAELVDALVPQLDADLRLSTPVESIGRDADGRYQITTRAGDTLSADAVVLTTPAYTAADLLGSLAPEVADRLRDIRYVSTGTLSLAYRADAVRRPLHGFGLVIPRGERRPINAITVSSTKFDQRAPAGYVLLRVFFGGSRSPASMNLNDEALLGMVRGELRQILGIEAAPLFHRVYRWHNANPQYDVGHLERVDAIEAGLPGGLYVAGSAYRGVGIPDCVHQSQQGAGLALDYLKQSAPVGEVTAR